MNPHFEIAAPAGPVRGVALVLHGGRASSRAPVRRTNLTVVRMTPFASSLRRAGTDLGLAVARLRYVVRGWNGGAQSPVADVRWGACVDARVNASKVRELGEGGEAGFGAALRQVVKYLYVPFAISVVRPSRARQAI